MPIRPNWHSSGVLGVTRPSLETLSRDKNDDLIIHFKARKTERLCSMVGLQFMIGLTKMGAVPRVY